MIYTRKLLSPKPKSVSIIGMGSSSREYWLEIDRNDRPVEGPPFDVPTDAVWGANRIARHFQGLDLIFALDDLRRMASERGSFDEWLQVPLAPTPIITSKCYPEYLGSFEYPWKAVQKSIGLKPASHRDLWLDNTINYMLAFALYAGIKKIRLYGCEWFARDVRIWGTKPEDGEPDWHTAYRPEFIPRFGEPGIMTLCWLIGIAQAQGVDVYIPQGSTLLDNDLPPFLYGYQEQPV